MISYVKELDFMLITIVNSAMMPYIYMKIKLTELAQILCLIQLNNYFNTKCYAEIILNQMIPMTQKIAKLYGF